MDNKYERVEADDPRRCQHVIPTRGQCTLQAVEGGSYCISHGGAGQAKVNRDGELRNYRLGKWKAKIGQHTDPNSIKCLRDEVAIMRTLIEEKMELCGDVHDLMLQSGPISDLVMKVEKLVTSCNRLETHLGAMLDKTQALQWAAEIVEIVGKHVEDEEALSAIADELMQSLDRLAQPKSR